MKAAYVIHTLSFIFLLNKTKPLSYMHALCHSLCVLRPVSVVRAKTTSRRLLLGSDAIPRVSNELQPIAVCAVREQEWKAFFHCFAVSTTQSAKDEPAQLSSNPETDRKWAQQDLYPICSTAVQLRPYSCAE